MTDNNVSACCIGERCFCGQPASAKVEETIFHDDWSMTDDGPNGSMPRGMRGRHPLTSYVCAEHFSQIMHPSQRVSKEATNAWAAVPVANKHLAFVNVVVNPDPDKGFASPDDPFAPIAMIALYDAKDEKTFLVAIKPKSGTTQEEYDLIDRTREDVWLFDTEEEMLQSFFDILEPIDVITGWNSFGYDLPYLVNRIRLVMGEEATVKLCRFGVPPKRRSFQQFGRETKTYDLVGREHFDTLKEYMKRFDQPTYRLGTIAEVELGDAPIQYNPDPRFIDKIDGCVHDAELVYRIFNATGMTLEDVLATVDVDALPAPKTNLLNIHPDPTGKLFVCSSKGKHPGFGKSHAEAIGAYIAMNSGDFPIEINVSNEARALADKISDKKAAKQAKKDKKRRKK